MKFAIKVSVIVLASVFTATTVIFPSAEASPTSTSEQMIVRAEQQNNRSRKRVRRTKRQPLRSTRPTGRNQQSLTYNEAVSAGLIVAYDCGYSQGTNTSACTTFNNSISILSNGCNKGDRNACQWVRKLYDLEGEARLSRFNPSLYID
jgi:hypothetical protein